jgi:phosphoglycerol transferase MdoB-like AlkP superfamily enzyme
MAEGLTGTMKVPTFGGGTLRTEFETLTSIPMSAYPRIGFPYLQINLAHIPSLVGVLHKAGYSAYAIHGNDRNFWNRAKAFQAMGFDRFYAVDDFPKNAPHDGWYLSDEAMTEQIESRLDNADKPIFIMAVSIEGHGPYGSVPVSDKEQRNAIPVPGGWPQAAENEYRNYTYHISDADAALGRLRAYLERRGRPFVLAFYGDHLPGLQYVYDAAGGFDDGREATKQFVPWLLIGPEGSEPRGRHINSWMLGSEILRAAGLPDTPYYTLVDRADRAQVAHPAAAETVELGVDSLARLYLKGKPMPVVAGGDEHPALAERQ